jgi:hypothetical protein
VLVKEDFSASWRCHRATCGFTGSFHLGTFLRQLSRSRQQQHQQQARGAGDGSSSNGDGSHGDGGRDGGYCVQQAPGANGGGPLQQQGDPGTMQALQDALASGPVPARRRPLVRPSPAALQPLSQHPQLLAWFSRLGIGQAALAAAGAMAELVDGVPMAAFPQHKGGQLCNVSYLHTGRCEAAQQQLRQQLVPPGASWQVGGPAGPAAALPWGCRLSGSQCWRGKRAVWGGAAELPADLPACLPARR